MKPLSYSQITLYQQCPLHYKLLNIDGLEAKEKGYFSFGSVLHLCAQHFFGVPVPPPPTIDELLSFYEENWKSEGYQSAEDEAKYKKYGKEILSRFCEIQAAAFSLPVAVEYLFTVDVDGIKLRGYIDKVDKLDSGHLSITDYKSNKNLFTADYVQQDLQLTLYQIAAEKIWQLPVEKLSLYHLRTNTPCCCHSRSKEQLEEARHIIHEVAELIAANEFPATENQFCPCDFPEHCPYYRHKYVKTEEVETKDSELDVENAVEEYAQLQSQIKSLELTLSEIKQKLLDYCQSQGLRRVFGSSHTITYSVMNRTGFDEDEVKKLLEPLGLWDKVLSLDESKLKDLMKDEAISDDLSNRLNSLKEITSQSPRLSVKKLAEDE
jgi:putative RecB family exonuclease